MHGRNVGEGALIGSVRSIRLVLADGSLVDASTQHNSELFHGAIGGYGGLGVIVEATLGLAENSRIARESQVMPLSQYRTWFDRGCAGTATWCCWQRHPLPGPLRQGAPYPTGAPMQR